MSKTNARLALVVGVLLVLSILTYRQSIGRADRFQRGQLFLPNLNPDEVVEIGLTKGDSAVTLRRQGQQFTVVDKHGYRASNSSVNRLLRDLTEIGLERQVGRSEELAGELEIEPPAAETVEVSLRDAAGKPMVRLRVGKSFDQGPGNYVRRLDDTEAPIYLTSKGVFLSADPGSFLDKQIVDHPRDEVQRIEGVDFELTRKEGGKDLELAAPRGSEKAKTTELDRLQTMLSGLRFEEVFVADDPEVRGLELTQALRIDLEDGSGYELSHAERDDRHFLSIRGHHGVQQVAISRDESEEELQVKAEQLTRADEIEEFNTFHGSWIYEISEWTAEKLQLRRADLIAAEGD